MTGQHKRHAATWYKEAVQGYCQPDPELVAILDAPPTPWLFLSPDGGAWLSVEHRSMPTLADVAQKELRLAGLRIDTVHEAQHQLVFGHALAVEELETGARIEFSLPSGLQLRSIGWSHDSQRFALTLSGEGGTELWCGLRSGGPLRRLLGGISAIFSHGFQWFSDSRTLLVTCIPAGRGPAPQRPAVAPAPRILEAHGESTPMRTWPDLIKDKHDENVLAHHARLQLCLVDCENGISRGIGAPDFITECDVSPDGRHILIERLLQPFPHTHLIHAFAHRIEVLDSMGRCVHTVADVPVAENIPIEGVRCGPRAVQWAPHGDGVLQWVEALDGGDPRRAAPHRDRWMLQEAPFSRSARELLRLEHRASSLAWLPDGRRFVARQYDRDRRWTRLALHDGADGRELSVLDDRSVKELYRDPGALLMRPDGRGRRVVRVHEDCVLRVGAGQSESDQRPFLAREHLLTRERTELWRAEERVHERLVAPLDDQGGCFLTLRESRSEVPNLFLFDRASHTRRALTRYEDPAPILRRMEPRIERYTRSDGVALSGKLYLPPDWDGRPLPLVLWAYPEDYADGDIAGQTRASPHQFVRISGASPLFFALRGYAVLDETSIPVVGHPETMNDTFIEQAVASARAAIEHLAGLGVADPARVGVGGHSYGAFMTAVLLAHSELFRAGIARSGAYNRTLTPFGFQHERRTLWEAKDTYVKLSPLLDAQNIRAPLLLIHGEEDPNPGTSPLQSERLFQALKGTGGRARQVVLPHESHGYRARESVLHVLWEMLSWFDEHVKR